MLSLNRNGGIKINKIDYIIMGIVLLFVAIGYFRGIVYSVLKIVEYVLSVFLAFKFCTIVSSFLTNQLDLEVKVGDWILAKLPGTADFILRNSAKYTGFDESSIIQTAVIQGINILSIILLFIVLKILFGIIIKLINKIMSLPILKEANKLGGIVFGLVEGLIIVYILLIIVKLLPFFELKNEVDNSVIGSKVNLLVPDMATHVMNFIDGNEIIKETVERT